MILSEYAAHLNKFIKENPTAGKLDVAYSSDDEGNNFSKVYYSPSIQKITINGGDEVKCVVIN